MDIQTLPFSQDSFHIIKKELLALREENAWLKGKLEQMGNKLRWNDTKDCSGKKFGVGVGHVNGMSIQELKQQLAQREKEILQAGNDNFLKDNLIEEQSEQLEILKKQNANLKQMLSKLQPQQQNQQTSKIGQFFMSELIQSLPFEHAPQQTGKRKLLRKHRLQFDTDSFTSTQTSDEFIKN